MSQNILDTALTAAQVCSLGAITFTIFEYMNFPIPKHLKDEYAQTDPFQYSQASSFKEQIQRGHKSSETTQDQTPISETSTIKAIQEEKQRRKVQLTPLLSEYTEDEDEDSMIDIEIIREFFDEMPETEYILTQQEAEARQEIIKFVEYNLSLLLLIDNIYVGKIIISFYCISNEVTLDFRGMKIKQFKFNSVSKKPI